MVRVYDPIKAHAYYEQHKKLKGRKSGTGTIGGKPSKKAKKVRNDAKVTIAKARIGRLRGKISKLIMALSEAEAELSKKRQSARETKKKSSDGKTTTSERQASKSYRDKNQQKLANKRKQASSSGGSSSNSSSKSVSDMTVEELTARVDKIRTTLKDARRQLSNANQELGQLAHSAITSEPDINELFAQFQSAERIPSK